MKTSFYCSIGLFCFFAALFGVSTRASAAVTPVETTLLPQKSTLLVRSDRTTPRVAISLLVRAGAADETASNSGWRQVLTNAILQTTRISEPGTLGVESKEQGVVEISDWEKVLDVWGGEIGATVDDDAIEFWISGDSARTSELLQVLLQIVQSPRLSDDELTSARRQVLSIQDQAKDDIASLATQALSEHLYTDPQGNTLAYALPDFGSFESLSSFDNAHLREQYQQFFTPDRFTFAVAGDVDSQRVAEQLNRLIEERSASKKPDEKIPEFAAISAETSPVKLHGSDRGSWVFMSYRAPSPGKLTPSESAAFEVLSAALVGSSQARLPQRFTSDEEKTLVAQAGTEWTKRRFASELTLFVQAADGDTETIQKILLEEIARLAREPLSASELQDAKNYVRGQWAVSRSTLHERSYTMALASLHSATPDTDWPKYFQEATAEQVQKVASQYLNAPVTLFLLPQE